MSQVSQLSPELARGLLQLARALLVAARNRTLDPPEHPNVGVSVSRLCEVIREGLATARIRAIMGEQSSPAFNQPLLKRFVNLIGHFPIGTLVRLNTEELAVVTAEQPGDPSRPQVKVVAHAKEDMLEAPLLSDGWDRHDRGEHTRAVVEAIDPQPMRIDPLKYL